ncbi:alkaline phosphatase-like protein [Aspergillus campestris IBT 28561]|uniref:Alkaline phosphatase-like protein n=1 Tax=Aspergillus campestris (strain IBT 28561) TaxID=1392248 RepID=A0A2I1DHT5_ASPC2|nr:alkaline phosphatase-like protein [Aspergillus campestris IBT 28561]PKY09432.1 alkaline phosphatase-like protein [Aspergillus campestris IBT 28561]
MSTWGRMFGMWCSNCCQGLWSAIKAPHLYFDSGWEASRQFLFSLIFISLALSKVLHVYALSYYLDFHKFLAYGPTFFLPEFALILFSRGLTAKFSWRTIRIVAALFITGFSLYLLPLTAANTALYLYQRREIHWGPVAGFFGDMITPEFVIWNIVLSIVVGVVMVITAYFLAARVHDRAGAFALIWMSSVAGVIRHCRRKKEPLPDPAIYEQIAMNDYEDDKSDRSDNESVLLPTPPRETAAAQPETTRPGWSVATRLAVILVTVAVLVVRIIRPTDRAYEYLSDPLPAAPFVPARSHPIFEGLGYLPGEYSWLGNHTALDVPPTFDWLPEQPPRGFGDWYTFTVNDAGERLPKDRPSLHYNPAKDPLRASNLDNDVLEPLRDVIRRGELKIKHVILMKLESNRHDVFPLRADSRIMDRVRESYAPGEVPEAIMNRLASLTPTAERLTGIDTGFGTSANRPAPRGGITLRNAHTTGTFTLKSLTSTMCGLTALTIAMNREWLYDFYQPCLPHVLGLLNQQPNITAASPDFRQWPWESLWMMSVNGGYDHASQLFPALGFQQMMTKETIKAAGGEFAPDDSEDVPYRGYMDKTLKNYVRAAIQDAEANHKRLFLGHLTGATHLPWTVPGWNYEELLGNTWFPLNNNINRYLNTLAYQDGWITDLIGLLEEANVADETLFIFVGDHGVSLPNDGGVTPNASPHIANEHVPMVLSHPKLPQVEVEDPVLSNQILPTILDMLLETGSLNDRAAHIVGDLLPLYEGQSMLRKQAPEVGRTQQWQFTTLNQGGTWLSVRSPLRTYHLVVPLVQDAKWRFSDFGTDPLELNAIKDFDVLSLIAVVRSKHGDVAADWVAEGAHIAEWWIRDNRRRWNYDEANPREP